jgi:hypothetical protein
LFLPRTNVLGYLSRRFGTGSQSALMADLLSAKLSQPADRKTKDKSG